MTDFSVEFELEPRQELEAEISLEQREEMEATFELNVIEEGPQGPVGPAGKDATINGVNTLTLETTNGITRSQDGSTLTISGKTLKDAITAETNRAESAESSLNTAISGKQAQLTQAQLNAVNSGITSSKVNSYDNHIANGNIHVTTQEKTTWNNKQNALSQAQMNAVNSGITTQKVTSYDNHISNTTIHVTQQDKTNWNGKQNALNSTQLEAVNSGITSIGVSQITTNKNNIASEVTNRQNADNGLQSQIDAIVASSDVTDIVGTYAQLQAYDTSTLPPNSIIKVLKDESQNDETTYYRWVITGGTGSWVLIGEEGPYYTKSQADERFATAAQGAKADTALQPSALNGYATKLWVGNQGYIKQAVDDSSTTSTTLGWSASKLNGIIGDVESLLHNINSGS